MSQAISVLFVEDDTLVRRSIGEALSSLGFRVLRARSGGEALGILERSHVDVLFTDVVMPGLNGIELAKQAKAMHPDIKVLLATGYLSRAHEAEEVGKLLYKPLRAHEIEAEIRELVTRH